MAILSRTPSSVVKCYPVRYLFYLCLIHLSSGFSYSLYRVTFLMQHEIRVRLKLEQPYNSAISAEYLSITDTWLSEVSKPFIDISVMICTYSPTFG
jgi:hypothetical protein